MITFLVTTLLILFALWLGHTLGYATGRKEALELALQMELRVFPEEFLDYIDEVVEALDELGEFDDRR